MHHIRKKNQPNYSLTNFSFNIRNYIGLSKLITLSSTMLFFIGGLYYAFSKTPIYQAIALLENKSYDATLFVITGTTAPFSATANNPFKEIALIQSPMTMAQVTENIKNPPAGTPLSQRILLPKEIKTYVNHIVVDTPTNNSNLVRISLNGTNAPEITQIVNIAADVAEKNSSIRLQNEINNLLASFEQEHQILKNTIYQQQKNMRLQQATSRSIDEDRQLIVQHELNLLIKLETQIYRTKTKLSAARLDNVAKSPKYIKLSTIYRQLLAKRKKLQKTINELSPKSESSVDEKLSLQKNLHLLNILDQKTNKMKSIKAAHPSNIRIIQTAEIANNPVSYPRIVIIALAIIFGLLFGYILSIALD